MNVSRLSDGWRNGVIFAVGLSIMLVAISASAGTYYAYASGPWTSTNTWQSTVIPGAADTAWVNQPNVTVTYNSTGAVGEVYVLNLNTVINLATNLNNPAGGLHMGGGGYGSGPGLVRTYGYNITAGYLSYGDWGYGYMDVDPGTTITAGSIADQNQGSRMTVAHAAGKNGLTFVIPSPNIQSNFRLRLNYDPFSKVTDWAFRWQGTRKSSIDTWLSDGRMAYTNVQGVRVVEELDGYTYVYGVPSLLWTTPTASNITDSAANAYVSYTFGGYTNMALTLYWGTTDGGTTNTAWASTNILGTSPTGSVAGAVSGLVANTRYYFRFYATNTEARVAGWSAAGSFTTPWYPEVDNTNGAVVSVGSAILRGNLTAGNVADIYIYWGRIDGGTSTSYENVVKLADTPQGEFQATVGVGYGFSNYYYVCFASNSVGTDWAPASTNFSMPEPKALPPTSGLVAWYDAGFGVTSDGTGVLTWSDRSGQGHDATRASGAPTLVPNQLNGLPIIQFRNNNSYLNVTGTLFAKEHYYVFRCRPDRTTWSNYGNVFGKQADDRNSSYLFENNNTVFHSNQYPLNVSRNGSTLASPFDMAPINQYMVLKVDVNDSGTAVTAYRIGGQAGYVADMDLAEILIYSNTLSAAAENTVGGYLAWKYNITTTYPPASAPPVITNALVSNLTTNSATLNGNLSANGWTLDVYAYWGTNNGLNVAANWQTNAFIGTFHNTGSLSLAVSDLGLTTRYYYAFSATNTATNIWAQPSGEFYTLGPVTASNGPVTGITQTRATLGANIASGGFGELRVYWGLTDGETNASAWANTNSFGGVLQGAYTTTVTVRAGAPYYYRVYATNSLSEDWADGTMAFTTPVPAVSLTTMSTNQVVETGQWATVTATLSAPSVSNVTVNFSFGGTAAKNTDYTSSADGVVIGAGTLSSNIILTAVDDVEQEENETIIVSILSLSCATNGAPAIVTNTITSDDPQVTNGSGASAVTASNATLNGVLTMGDRATVKVFWGDNDGMNSFTDWDATNVLGVRNEDVALSTNITGLTANKTYYYRYYATNSSLLADDWADSTASFSTIAPTISINDVMVTEGNSNEITATFSVRISTPSFIDVSVTCTTSNGTATTAGLDYIATNAVVTIAAGQSNAAFTVTVLGDVLYETPDEFFYVNLTAPSNCTLGDAQGVGTIDDDDLVVNLAHWRNRMKITFTGYNKQEILTNFPALVVFKQDSSGFLYSGVASPAGGDIRFANSNEMVFLNHEIEYWNISGNSYAWVQVPLLVNSNTYIWAYWGNAAETNPPPCTTNGAVWTAGFHQVYHMTEPNARDSTTNRLHGTAANGAVASTGGLIGDALSFSEGGAGAVSLPYYDRNSTPYTLSAWINTADADGAILGWVFYEPQDHLLMQTLNGKLRFYLNAWTGNNQMLSPQDVNDSQWHYCVAVRGTNSAGKLYVDGAQVASTSIGSTRGGGSSFMGRTKAETWSLGVPSDYYYNGLMDEVRVADANSSSNWIWASWMTVASNRQFCTMMRYGYHEGTVWLIR